MATTRNVLRGTFRLSIAVAVLAAIYGSYEQWTTFYEYRNGNQKLVTTLECGARLSEAVLKPALNQAGLIDLSKVGCADKQFMASFSELDQARTGEMRREWLAAAKFNWGYASSYSFGYALLALLVVNALGLALVTLRAVFLWIVAGYKATS